MLYRTAWKRNSDVIRWGNRLFLVLCGCHLISFHLRRHLHRSRRYIAFNKMDSNVVASESLYDHARLVREAWTPGLLAVFFFSWFAHPWFGLGRVPITPPGPAMVFVDRKDLNKKKNKKKQGSGMNLFTERSSHMFRLLLFTEKSTVSV